MNSLLAPLKAYFKLACCFWKQSISLIDGDSLHCWVHLHNLLVVVISFLLIHR